MSYRILRAGQLLGQGLVAQQQRQAGNVSSFLKQVREQLDSNPELKKGLDSVKQGASDATQTLRRAAETAKQTASQAAEDLRNPQKSVWPPLEHRPTKQTCIAKSSISEVQAAKPDASTDPNSAAARDQTGTASSSAPGAGAHSAQGAQADRSQGSGHQQRQRPGQQQTGSAGAGAQQGAQQQAAAAGGGLSRLWAAARNEVAAAVLPRPRTTSATRAPAMQPAASTAGAGAGTSQVMVVQEQIPGWKRHWRDMQAKLGAHPMFRGLWDRTALLRKSKVVEKGRHLREDLRERWETADNRVVHKIQDISDSWATESEPAQVLREIRSRDPNFDMIRFLYDLRADVPVVIKAFLTGNVDTLRQHCTPDCVERLSGIIRAQEATGSVSDPTILDYSDVELADLKFLDDDPIVVTRFTVQQIDCARDKYGNVVEGSPDTVQKCFYFWALQQDSSGFVGADGKHYPPRFQVKEMLVQGMVKLLG